MSIPVSVVIPVYNERTTIEEILLRVQAVDIEKELVIVEDGSTDGTREFLAELGSLSATNPGLMELDVSKRPLAAANIRVFFQDSNRGNGAAFRRGFQEARGEIIVIQDADLEYDPQDLHGLIEPIIRGDADVVCGSRFLGGPYRVLFFWHYVDNKFLTTLSNAFTDLNLSDVWTCYKAFRREVLEQLDLQEKRFGFEQEITCKIANRGWHIYEIPISYHGRTYGEGKKSPGKTEYGASGASSETQAEGGRPELEGRSRKPGSGSSFVVLAIPRGGMFPLGLTATLP